MNIPLINSNSKQDINTSLIAIRNAINELSRMKESESVEDLQRQINIINQQIANFNSEFSAINTHLNTIDTNILNLQPVDTVASGNLHSVTSNATANLFRANKYAPDINNAIEIGSYNTNPDTLNIPSIAYGVMFVFGFNPETPSTSTQWIYQLLLQTDGVVYIRQSVNSNSITPTNWSNWQKISLEYTKVRGTITSDSSGNLPLNSLLPTQEVEIIYVKGTDINNNRPIIPTRDGNGYWFGQLFEWNSFTKVPNTTMSVEICYRVL